MWSVVNKLINGPMHTFMISYHSCPYSGRAICHSLKKKGVNTYAPQIVGGTIMFDVKLKQAAWASHLLERWGVPVLNPIPKSQRVGRKRKKTRRKKITTMYRCSFCGRIERQWSATCPGCGSHDRGVK